MQYSNNLTLSATFLKNEISQPILLSFGKEIFKSILTKAEKWEIEKKI